MQAERLLFNSLILPEVVVLAKYEFEYPKTSIPPAPR